MSPFCRQSLAGAGDGTLSMLAAMPEAVIVATARSPIGRAFKGSLVDMRPDDLTAQMLRALLDKVPELDPAEIEDLMLGNGQPAGEAGFNLARVVAVLAGLDHVPGVTVNRYCSSSLQTIRMAAHAIRAGEGDVFVAAGVETVSRFANGNSDGVPGTHNELFAEAEARSAARGRRWSRTVDPAGRPSRHLHRDGPDRRERRRAGERQPRRDGRVRGAVAEPGRGQRRERLLRARDHARDAARRHVSWPRTTARARTRPSRSSLSSSRCSDRTGA